MAKENESTYSVILGVCLRLMVNIVFLFLLVEGFTYSYRFSYELFADLPASAASESVSNITIPEGAGVREVSGLLEDTGMVSNQYIFLARAYLGKYNHKIQSGTYTLSPSMTPDEICKMLCGIQSEDAS